MKKILLLLTVFCSLHAFADSGFLQLEKLFNDGQVLNIKSLKSIDQGIYVGRCFKYENNYPYGAAASFKNMSQNSGPIVVDPELYIGFSWTQQTDYFDQVNIKDYLDKLTVYKAEKMTDDISYEVNLQTWWLQYRTNGEYILQKNIIGGIDDSYCYFYSFRTK